MRFIHIWSYSFANYLMKQLNEDHQKRRVYYYGFQIIIGAVVKGVLLVAISLLIGTLIPTLIAVAVFASLRVMAGGYHMDTYGKCIGVSLLLFVISGIIAKYSYQYWSFIYLALLIAVSFLIGLFVIYKWAPKDTTNRRITNPEEIKKFRIQSFTYIFVFLIANIIFYYMHLYMFSIAACLGLLLEVFTIAPAGYKFFDAVNGKLSFDKH